MVTKVKKKLLIQEKLANDKSNEQKLLNKDFFFKKKDKVVISYKLP